MTGGRGRRTRLVALDLDGTLLNSRCEISPRNLSALRVVAAAGVRLVVATGRSSQVAARWIRKVAVGGYHVTYNGAAVVDYERAAHFNVRRLGRDCARRVTAWLRERGAWYAAHTLDGLYSPWHGEEEARAFASIGDPVPEIADVEPMLHEIVKVMLVVPEGDPLETDVRAELGWLLAVSRTSPHLVELTSPQASKGAALAWVAAAYGVRRDEIVAVGDSENDVSMFEHAGLAVAMGNASDDARRAAQVVCEDCDSDGVASALEQYVIPFVTRPLR